MVNNLQKAFRWMLTKAAGVPVLGFPGSFSPGWGSFDTNSGAIVTPESALQYSAIWAAVRIRALMMGHLPLGVYRRRNGKVEPATDSPMYALLHDSPNPYMTSMEFREAVSVNYDLFGNAFVEIKKRGAEVGLHVLDSHCMTVETDDKTNAPVYKYSTKTGIVTYKPSEIMHIRNFSLNGIFGLNPIEQERHVIGMALAQQKFGGSMYRNGGRPSGVLEHPGNPSDPDREKLRNSWEALHNGPDNSGKVAILWGGMKYNAIGMSAEDMQFIESRKFQVTEIARIYGVPPHLLGDLERATFANIEQQSIEFVAYSLAPHCVKWEQRINQSLLAGSGVYAKFNLSALMRGDAASRANFYSSMVQNGIMSRDECRELEELNARGDRADELTVQSNMIDLSALQSLSRAQLPDGSKSQEVK